jgi:hypothetical protein
MSNGKRTLPVVLMLAVAIVIFAVMPRLSSLSAQESGADTVGAWYGKVFVAPGVGFPFQAVFNRDGTWTGTDARGFGQIPLTFPFTAVGSTFSGSWTRKGAHTYQWTGTQILVNPSGNAAPAGYYVLVARGTHEVRPGDPNHMTNGQAGATIFPCGPTAFGCPDSDTIVSNSTPFNPTFTFALSRVRPR